jgi:hypothetical protein
VSTFVTWEINNSVVIFICSSSFSRLSDRLLAATLGLKWYVLLANACMHFSVLTFCQSQPIYATLSDIGESVPSVPGQPDSRLSLNDRMYPYGFTVLYSPNGATRGVCDLAERIKEAIETKAFERNCHQPVQAGTAEGEFAHGTLAYNVFVVTGRYRCSFPLRSGSMRWPMGRKAERGAGVPCSGAALNRTPVDPELPSYLSLLSPITVT